LIIIPVNHFTKKKPNLPILALRVTRYALGVLISLSLIQASEAQSSLPENSSLRQFLDNKELRTAHVGVYVYDDSSKKVIADYQSDKYFVPASNTKLFSLYAGMKYLGDSLVGIRYMGGDTSVLAVGTGDPTLLHPDFLSQPVIQFLKSKKKIVILPWGWQETALGVGWAWDDYNDDYSVERSPFPVYGNFIRWNQEKSVLRSNASFEETPTVFSSPEISWPVRFNTDTLPKTFLVKRLMDSNVFIIRLGNELNASQDVPFITGNLHTIAKLLEDTLGNKVEVFHSDDRYNIFPPLSAFTKIYSRPVDSIFVPMMHRSDNFFAEQTLLMVSNERLGLMKDETIIDTLLNGPLADLPQKPSWVDGSGLSRFNLFTPQDFVTLLIKFKNEFGMERMKRILPTGGKGTLKNHYLAGTGYVFAKTGSMTGVICLSGYVYTVKKHLLEFSILVNNEIESGPAIRREIERYVESLRRNN
jgi:serine-type D-Ala-D-Ala carboxypeptidase/endopeptidase (penicillin-binding protein 4)